MFFQHFHVFAPPLGAPRWALPFRLAKKSLKRPFQTLRIHGFEQASGSRLIGLPCPLAPKTFPNVFHTMHPGSIQEHPGSPAGRPWQLEARRDTSSCKVPIQNAARARGILNWNFAARRPGRRLGPGRNILGRPYISPGRPKLDFSIF